MILPVRANRPDATSPDLTASQNRSKSAACTFSVRQGQELPFDCGKRAFRLDPNEVGQLIAKPGRLPLGVLAGVALAAFNGFGLGNLAVEVTKEPRHAMRLHRRQIGIEM